MTHEEIVEKVNSIVAEELDMKKAEIDDDVPVWEYGADSLDMATISCKLDEELECTIDADVFENLVVNNKVTVNDIADLYQDAILSKN